MQALLPCPFCGKSVDIDEWDTLYPIGIFWRDDQEEGHRSYHTANERREGDGVCWGLNCAPSVGGCGAEMHGDSKEETIAAWNRRLGG